MVHTVEIILISQQPNNEYLKYPRESGEADWEIGSFPRNGRKQLIPSSLSNVTGQLTLDIMGQLHLLCRSL